MATFVERGCHGGRMVCKVLIRRREYSQQTRTFDRKTKARAWAAMIESEIAYGVFVSRLEAEATTPAEAPDCYLMEVTPCKRDVARESLRVLALRSRSLVWCTLAGIRGKEIAKLKFDRESEGAGPNTIRLDLALFSHLFNTARAGWAWNAIVNPVSLMQDPPLRLPSGRERRLREGEEARLLAARGSWFGGDHLICFGHRHEKRGNCKPHPGRHLLGKTQRSFADNQERNSSQSATLSWRACCPVSVPQGRSCRGTST